MDTQDNFFSPGDLGAQGYGGNVGAFYLNLTDPAGESAATLLLQLLHILIAPFYMLCCIYSIFQA